MNVFCPHCRARYRVDPNRIPSGGARARCAACGEVFPVVRRERAGAGAMVAGAVTAAAVDPPHSGPSAPAPPRERVAGAGPMPGHAADPAIARAADRARNPVVAGKAAAGADAPGSPASPPVSVPAPVRFDRVAPVFGPQDRNARAQRLARAIVSDIVAYHGEKRDHSLAAGTLRADFRGEILKSWNEYVEQVGSELATSTPYFRAALNEILARGQMIF